VSLRVILRAAEPIDFENGVFLCAPNEGHISVVVGRRLDAKGVEVFEPVSFIPTILVVRADVIPEPPLALAPPLHFEGTK
jgi:hypothetical protein